MKRLLTLLLAVLIVGTTALPAYAANGKVTYSGNSGSFIFEPGSDYSPTDLFPNFKDVMPGDTLSQKITVKNDANKKVKVKIYMRALGAHEDSVEFLNKLRLLVTKSDQNEMAYMFDAAADKTAQLTDWVCLGTLYSGGTVDLNVMLDVPVDLDNQFQQLVGYLDWEFKVEEFPIEPGDPGAPPTGDSANLLLWVCLLAGSGVMILLLLLWRKKEKSEN